MIHFLCLCALGGATLKPPRRQAAAIRPRARAPVAKAGMLGVPTVLSDDVTGIPAAVAAAKAADAVVLAVGTDLTWAAEGKDATSIVFTAAQLELIDAVAEASATPVVVVVFSATPLDLSPLLARSDGKVGAVVHVGQPSVTVKGLGDLLYGRRSFAGRAVQTVYPAAYADQISIFDFNMRPGPSAFARPDCAKNESACPRGTNPGRTYRFYVDEPVVPFGFGLSYTTFAYAVRSAPKTVDLAPLRGLHTCLGGLGSFCCRRTCLVGLRDTLLGVVGPREDGLDVRAGRRELVAEIVRRLFANTFVRRCQRFL